MIIIGDKQFKSQIELRLWFNKKKIKLLDNNSYLLMYKPHKYFQLFKDFLMRHPSSEKKEQIKNVEIIIIFKISKQIKIKELDNLPIDIVGFRGIGLCLYSNKKIITLSVEKCISGRDKTDKGNLNDAMRNSIQYQIDKYRLNRKIQDEYECFNCKTKTILEVDHIYEFNKIRDEFLRIQNKIPMKFNKDKNTKKPLFIDKDIKFEEDWKEWHFNNSRFQLLCGPCHKNKSRQIFIGKNSIDEYYDSIDKLLGELKLHKMKIKNSSI